MISELIIYSDLQVIVEIGKLQDYRRLAIAAGRSPAPWDAKLLKWEQEAISRGIEVEKVA